MQLSCCIEGIDGEENCSNLGEEDYLECRKMTALEVYHDRDGLTDTKKSIDNQVHISYGVISATRRHVVKCSLPSKQ